MPWRARVIVRAWPSTVFRVIVGIWALAIAAFVLVPTLLDRATLGAVEVAFAALFGVVFPVWLASLHIVVGVRDDELCVAVSPVFYRRRIPIGAITEITSDIEDPLRYHGGFLPLVGLRDDRVLGFNQDGGVRIAVDGERGREHLTILAFEADRLAQQLRELRAGAG